MAETEKKPVYTKVTVDTPLYIDFDFWKSKELNWRSLLAGYLCEDHYQQFKDAGDGVRLSMSLIRKQAKCHKKIF